MASLDFEKEKSDFLEWYHHNAVFLNKAVESFRTLISLLLTDREEFPTPSVHSRVKNASECVRKFERKYRADLEAQNTPYIIRDHITDLLGVRVICLYEDNIPSIRNVLAEEFTILSETDKSKSLEVHEAEFGYKGLHLDLGLSDRRTALPEYSRFKSLRYEVQIQTTAQDAWSTLDHEIKYKRVIPSDLQRRVSRLAALFELADQEFRLIRDRTVELESLTKKSAEAATPALTTQAPTTAAASPIDAISFNYVLTTAYPEYRFFGNRVDSFLTELLSADPHLTVEGLSQALSSHRPTVERFKQHLWDTRLARLNPYTVIRHVLYLADKDKYGGLLFSSQKATFDAWLKPAEQAH